MSKQSRDPKYTEHPQRHAPPALRGRRPSIAYGSERDYDPKTVRSPPKDVLSYPGLADMTSASNASGDYETTYSGSGYSNRIPTTSLDPRNPRDSEQPRVSFRDGRGTNTSDPRDLDETGFLTYDSRENRDLGQARGSTRDSTRDYRGSRDSDQVSSYGHRDKDQTRASTQYSRGPRDSDQALTEGSDNRAFKDSERVRGSTRDGRDVGDADISLGATRKDRDTKNVDQTYTSSRHDLTKEVSRGTTNVTQQYPRHGPRKPDELKEDAGTPTLRPTTLAVREKIPGANVAKLQSREAGKIREEESSDEDADEYPFTDLRNRVCRIFVKIPVTDHKDRIDFLENNPELMKRSDVDLNMSLLLKQAIDFSRMGKSMPAVACILCLAMIRLSKDQKQLRSFFRQLADPSSEEKKGYIRLVKAIQDTVTKQAEEEGKLAPPSRKKIAANRPIPKPAAPEEDVTDLSTLRISDLFGSAIRPEYTIQASDEPPTVVEDLNPKYKIRANGRQFFCPGRVFGVLWHEGTAKRVVTEDLLQPRQSDRTISRGPYGQAIYSHFRRMVVVKTRRASCWCVAIGTYGGQGLCKKGLQPDEINAHTIIHESTRQATYLKGEPRTDKRPIRIQMATGATLDVASRVHLGKPYNVEFNLKVMDVGRVHPEDLDILINYVRMELGLDT